MSIKDNIKLSIIQEDIIMRGKLIVLFGIDGSGKSTILEMLKNSDMDNTVYTSCLVDAIFEEELYRAEKKLHFSRKDIFSHEFKHVLHIGSVIYNMFNKILPLLNQGKNVVLDRYSICIRLFTDLFLEPSCSCLSKSLACLPIPDFGVYFDVDIDTAIQRIQERSNKNGTLPHYSESKEALIMKQAGYETIIPTEVYPISRIDANQNINEVYSDVLRLLSEICVPHSNTHIILDK